MILPGQGMRRLAKMSRWAGVSSAVCRKVPAGPVKVPRVSWLGSSLILFQVVPAVVARQPRPTSRSCLYPAAMSAAGSLGSEARSRYLPSRFSSALI
jgi:hypothetical protein